MAQAKDAFDIRVKGLSKERIGLDISRCLSLKGFCVIEPDVEERQLSGALAEALGLEEQGLLQQPPTMIVDGLLGVQGSSKICDLGLPDGEDPDRMGGESLGYVDAEMTELGMMVMPYLPSTLGIEVKSRTGGLLNGAGMPLDEGPELTGEVCAKWINIFAHHRIMCIWCLGPEKGSLELQPFDEECNGMWVPMQPGTLVMLRPDALQHRFTSAGKAYCLTCFFQKESRHCKHRPDREGDLTPCCQALEAWAFEKMREYKESLPEEQARLSIPRSWELAASHSSFVGQHIAVRSGAVRQVSSFDTLAWSCAFLPGPDYIMEVPHLRWDHSQFYQEETGTERKGGTTCRHGGFIDGVELFDNTRFRISKVEATGMDPGHRLTLETGYEALVRDGYKVSKLMNSRGGVYVANPPGNEWGETDKDVAGGVCGGGGSIACGRFSFTHGMKGPCISVDVEGASSLVAVNLASTNLCRIGNWEPIPFALCTSYNLQLNVRPYIFGTARGVFSPTGRTMSFDASADGYVRGDCGVSVVLKALTDVVDGDVVVSDQEDFLGALAASATNQSGRRAHVTAPDAAAFQEVIAECIRQADISPLDVDACDLFADGLPMGDAVEAAATAKAYRPDGLRDVDSTGPLSLLASKSPGGNQLESCGLSSILKIVIGAQFGVIHPNLHLRMLNFHADLEVCERPAHISSEALEYSLETCYNGIANRSLTGTNCHVLAWGQLTEERSAPAPAARPRGEKILFWPEGGGDLDEGKLPRRGYNILGTWSKWEPQPMLQEGPGMWVITFTLGVNRWERFQIALDGSKDRVLYPEYAGAGKGARVLGPAPALRAESWLVGGWPSEASTELTNGVGEPQEASALAPYAARSSDEVGSPGDRYQLRLQVRGKWRTVDWEKLAGEEPGTVDLGDYSLVGTWAHLVPQAMERVAEVEGLYRAEVSLPVGGGYFQILRDRDWGQVLSPAADGGVVGPGENTGHAWRLDAGPGDVFLVEFQRSIEGGRDEKAVTWRRLRREEPSRDILRLLSLPEFFIAGTWDDMQYPVRMNWTGSYYQAYIQLGPRAKESFQIHRAGDPRQCLYPSEPEANPHEPHGIRGPGGAPRGLRWTLGSDDRDEAAAGRRYEVRLRLREDGMPERLDWVPVKSVQGLEDAKGRGFLIFGA